MNDTPTQDHIDYEASSSKAITAAPLPAIINTASQQHINDEAENDMIFWSLSRLPQEDDLKSEASFASDSSTAITADAPSQPEEAITDPVEEQAPTIIQINQSQKKGVQGLLTRVSALKNRAKTCNSLLDRIEGKLDNVETRLQKAKNRRKACAAEVKGPTLASTRTATLGLPSPMLNLEPNPKPSASQKGSVSARHSYLEEHDLGARSLADPSLAPSPTSRCQSSVINRQVRK
jgi:hypothetical protein